MVVAPGSTDWLITFPTPLKETLNPLFSSTYSAFFNVIPLVSGTVLLGFSEFDILKYPHRPAQQTNLH